jgi:hypothetical protein
MTKQNNDNHTDIEKKTLVVACNMIHDEVVCAMTESGSDHVIEWIEEGLHSSIRKLHDAVQQALDAAETAGYERVLLAFGTCGNMTEDLKTHNFELIMPKTDDCVSLMLYPHRPAKQTGVYYLTRGWIKSGKNAWNDREQFVQRFGEKKADRLMAVLLGSYHSMSVIDTGAYPVDEIWAESLELADKLKLTHGAEQGSVDWIRQLITGPWDENFLRFGAHENVHIDLEEWYGK